jgi:sugar lactone lactonase YvrE
MRRRDFLKAGVAGAAVWALPEASRRAAAAPVEGAPVPVAWRSDDGGRRFSDVKGNLYDVFPTRGRVDVRSPDGTPLSQVPGPLDSPRAVGALPGGEVWVLEPERVRVYSPGRLLAPRAEFLQGRTEGLGAGRDLAVVNESVVVVDGHRHRVQVVDPRGRVVRTFGSLGDGPGRLNGPGSVAVAPDGHLHVADTGNFRVQVFTPAGRHVRTYGGWGTQPGQVQGARCVRVGADGTSYVVDAVGGCVHLFDASGRFLSRFLPRDGSRPVWLAVAGHGVVVSTAG